VQARRSSRRARTHLPPGRDRLAPISGEWPRVSRFWIEQTHEFRLIEVFFPGARYPSATASFLTGRGRLGPKSACGQMSF